MRARTRIAAWVAGALAASGCSGFGTECSTDADCTSKNPAAYCNPDLKVCFVRPGPVVTSIDPANQATGVTPAGATVTATFSEAINDAGVKDTTFIVDGQGFATFGVYTASSNATRETFTPIAAGLAVGTEYTVKLTAEIKDLQGRALTPFQSTFTTSDGVWQSDSSYTNPANTNLGDYSVAANYFGEVIAAVDVQIPDAGTSYSLSAGVSSGVLADGNTPNIDKDVYYVTTQEVFGPQVAISGNGRGFVAFNVISGGTNYAKASTYDPGTQSWAASVDLPVPLATPALEATVVALPAGNAVAAWVESVSAKFKVKSRAYGASLGWGASAFFIQSDANADCEDLRLATDLSFDVLAIWSDIGPSPEQVQVSYFPGTGNFSTPVPLSDLTVAGSSPDIALGYYGKGGAVWQAGATPATTHVFGRAFDPSANPAFGALKQIDTSPTNAILPRIGAAANGDLVAIWIEDTTAGGRVMTSRFTASNGTWGAPEVLVSDTAAPPAGAALTVDAGGNVLAVWLQQTGSAAYQAYARRFTVTGGWTPALGSPATRLTSGTDPVYGAPQMAVDALGLGSVFVSRLDTSVTPNLLYLDYIAFY
jgi:hypothetical protein